MTAPQELRTPRLLLRSLEREDIPAIVRLAGAREISSMTANIPHPYSEQDGQDFFARASEEFLSGLSVTFAICVSPGRELCGAVGLNITPAHQRAELGYWIGVPNWGKGYATEAAAAVLAFGFETLRVRAVLAARQERVRAVLAARPEQERAVLAARPEQERAVLAARPEQERAVLAARQENSLNRIYAFCFAENHASGRVLEKIGMRHEGRSRQHIKKRDRFVDLENYGVLRCEFLGEK